MTQGLAYTLSETSRRDSMPYIHMLQVNPSRRTALNTLHLSISMYGGSVDISLASISSATEVVKAAINGFCTLPHRH